MAKHTGRRMSPDQRISDGVGAFNKELEEAKDGISMIDMNLRNMSAIANNDFKAVPLRPSIKKLSEMLKSFQSKLKEYDLDMESAVKMHLSARKGPRHLTAMQMTPQKRKGKRKNPEGLRGTKSEEFMRWFTQGITLGLVRYDGTVLEWPDAKRFVDWWLHAYTLGIVKTEKPIGIEKGASILDYIARRFTIGLVGYGGEPTQVVTRTNPKRKKFNKDIERQLKEIKVTSKELKGLLKGYKGD
jgi:hypothetical protein